MYPRGSPWASDLVNEVVGTQDRGVARFLSVQSVGFPEKAKQARAPPTHPPTHESRLFAHTARMYALVEGGGFIFVQSVFSVAAPTMLLDLRMGLASDGNTCTIILAGWTRIHFIPKRGGLWWYFVLRASAAGSPPTPQDIVIFRHM